MQKTKLTKLLALLLALVLVLAACGPTTTTKEPAKEGEEPAKEGEEPAKEGEEPAKEGEEKPEAEIEERELTIASGSELDSMDYVVTDKAPDHEYNANFVDGLLENDKLGNLAPSIATEWESNDDATVWTFKLRDGVKWFTNTGEEFGTVTAEDFVTGLRHGADFGSLTSWIIEGVIKGYDQYVKSDKSDEAWEKVGIKAVDELTLEFTLENPTPYFASMTTYTSLYPINKEFLESMGDGCKLGAPDKETCEFGAKKPDSILYNGGFILSELTAKSQTVITKNPEYWDAGNIHLSKVTTIYDDGSDPYSIMKGFENGTYPQAALVASWPDYDKYLEKYKDNVYDQIANPYAFGINFNFNRQAFEHTAYANDEKMKENTKAALLNENFRKALRAAVDVEAYLATSAPEQVAKAQVRNINNFPEAGTSEKGTYFELVQKAHAELAGKEVNLMDGQYPWLNPEEAKAYIEKAKEEGIEFPVHLDIPVVKTSKRLSDQASSLKASVEENTDKQIIIELNMLDADVVENIAFRLEDGSKADYDISNFVGWGPDYADPKSFADTFSAANGSYLKNLGLAEGIDKDAKIKEKVGLMEYTKIVEEASKNYTDMNSRYEAFAKADAILIDKAFFIPTSQQARGQVVSKYVPFSRIYSAYGVAGEKYKGLQLQDEIVKTSERLAAQEEWEKARSESAK